MHCATLWSTFISQAIRKMSRSFITFVVYDCFVVLLIAMSSYISRALGHGRGDWRGEGLKWEGAFFFPNLRGDDRVTRGEKGFSGF